MESYVKFLVYVDLIYMAHKTCKELCLKLPGDALTYVLFAVPKH